MRIQVQALVIDHQRSMRMIVKNLRNQHGPILVLTGDADTLLHDVSRRVGAVSMSTKAVSGDVLGSHLETAGTQAQPDPGAQYKLTLHSRIHTVVYGDCVGESFTRP